MEKVYIVQREQVITSFNVHELGDMLLAGSCVVHTMGLDSNFIGNSISEAIHHLEKVLGKKNLQDEVCLDGNHGNLQDFVDSLNEELDIEGTFEAAYYSEPVLVTELQHGVFTDRSDAKALVQSLNTPKYTKGVIPANENFILVETFLATQDSTETSKSSYEVHLKQKEPNGEGVISKRTYKTFKEAQEALHGLFEKYKDKFPKNDDQYTISISNKDFKFININNATEEFAFAEIIEVEGEST